MLNTRIYNIKLKEVDRLIEFNKVKSLREFQTPNHLIYVAAAPIKWNQSKLKMDN